jgi:hypothetical protein
MKNFEQTILSQYGNSATITALIFNMNEYIRVDADIDNFYSFIWDVSQAQGFGLDIWGRIVVVSRGTLLDSDYRALIMLKALSNISASTAPSINQLLRNWMGTRGRCYMTDMGNMEIGYIFEFILEPFEIEILTQGAIFLRPAGVGGTVISSEFPVFGFSEAGEYTAAPFGQAPFIAETYAVS